jgi:hypothetical protein
MGRDALILEALDVLLDQCRSNVHRVIEVQMKVKKELDKMK